MPSVRAARALVCALALQTAAVPPSDASDWGAAGRPLPEPELRQPTLDPGLRPYRACDLPTPATLSGTAPSILPDLVARWVKVLGALNPRVRLEVRPPFGSPQGVLNPALQKFLTGSGDFAFLTRAMSRADRTTFEASHGYLPLIVPVSGGSFRHFGFVDPVVIVVNDANPAKHLKPTALVRLFAAGVLPAKRPVYWSDVGVSGWPDKRIVVVGGARWRTDESARGIVVRDRLLAGTALRGDLGADSGPERDVPARVAADPYAIGFTGLGHLRAGNRTLAVADAAGKYVAPTYHNVATARYPLARTIDLVLATPAGRPLAAGTAEFLRFLLSRDGQAVVLAQRIFLPLTATQAESALKRLGLEGTACPAGYR